jgi:hypothetical protein
MEEFKIADDLARHAREYLNIRADEIRLGLAEKTSKVLSLIIAGTSVMLIFFLCVIFAGMAGAYALGRLLGDTALGFVIVSAFFLLLGFTVWGRKESFIRIPIMNAIIHQLFETEEKTEDDDNKN